MNSVHEQCPNSTPNSDLNIAQNSALHQVACPMSRPHFDVATSRQQETCRDINWCRDTTQTSPGRDLKTGSRHCFSCQAPSQVAPYVATLIPCRDILKTNLCRDIVFMSRPPGLMSMSRHQIHVATSSPA